jgi:diguanylate cyclase (GGDEF)-like protein
MQRVFGQILKRLRILVVPTLILAAACFIVPKAAGLSPGRQELLLLSPYLFTGLGLFLSIHFHRGRPFMALVLLVLFYWSSRTYLTGRSLELALQPLFQALILLIPANLALIVLMRERGIFSPAGRLRFIFLGVQAVVAFWFFRYNFIAVLPLLAATVGLPHFLAPELIPQPAVLAGCAAFLVAAGCALYRQTPVDAGLLGALIAFFIAGNQVTSPAAHAAFSGAGALIITLSVLRDSYNMAFRDDLTGLPSRRSLNESLSGLGHRYAIAMLDVDHFKQFNDTYGHDVGDQVLRMVASKMMGVGSGGRAYRYGGEEFTILFPGRQAAEVIPELEQIRKSIASYHFSVRSSDRPTDSDTGKVKRGSKAKAAEVTVTISIGVAERGNDAGTADEVLRAADKALYKAKHRGRNQVCS